MPKITSLQAREILDSRGNPTVEVDLQTDKSFARAAVPSGASTGAHEAVELRDGDEQRYLGKGVQQAVRHVNEVIAPALKDFDTTDQRGLDARLIELDGTPNKGKLGANAILGVSIAAAKAASWGQGKELFEWFGELAGNTDFLLPTPMMNVLNGGVHGGSDIEIQEMMIIPLEFPNFTEALRAGSEVFQTLKKLLKEKGWPISVGDEGGVAPPVKSNGEAIDLIVAAIEQSGYTNKVKLAFDVAASESYDQKTDKYRMDKKELGATELTDFYMNLLDKYPIISIEDGMSEDDQDGWQLLTERLKDRIQLVGDDNFVTNPARLREGIEKGIANSILIKLNQIGTVTETIETVQLAQQAGYTTVISHRSGETEDTTIADLAVGLGAGQIKTGSLCRTDRICKYNQLLRIEEKLGATAKYAGNIFEK